MQQASPSNDSRPQVNTGGHILSFTADSPNTAASCKQRPHTGSMQGTQYPNPRSHSFSRSGIKCRLQKHETSAYLHMIRHFSPFHAPLTPPLMGMERDNSAPPGSPSLLGKIIYFSLLTNTTLGFMQYNCKYFTKHYLYSA